MEIKGRDLMKGHFFCQINIMSKPYNIYLWDDITELNKYNEQRESANFAFPERAKTPEGPYGCDAFCEPDLKEIHIMSTKFHSFEKLKKVLAHEIAHCIFWEKNKKREFEDENLVDSCAETYDEIYQGIECFQAVYDAEYITKVGEEKCEDA